MQLAAHTDNMHTRSARLRSGFTLMELMIVIAIIAVLVAIAIPLFFGQNERSRETVDLANARSAYSEVLAASMTQDPAFRTPNGDYKKSFALEQEMRGWETDVSDMAIGSVPSSDWVGEPQRSGTGAIIVSASTGQIVVNWESSAYEGQPLTILKEESNAERVAKDQRTLQSLGQAILDKNWTLQEMKSNLSILETGGAFRIANYYQLKSGSYASPTSYSSAGFKITSKNNTQLDDLLRSAGFYGGKVLATETSTDGKQKSVTYENSLFYSDELASNMFHNYDIDQTMRAIIIDNVKQENGKVTGFTIYTKAMDGQANMSDAEKAKFSIKIP